MAKAATLTLRLSDDLKDKIARLAARTDRTPSAVAQRGLTAYVDHQLRMLAEIDEGLEDFRLGRTVPHDEVVNRLRATVARHRPKT
ncbi:CopG family ribbon-helix-helix protein [Brevundimonas sp.]|uniref:CopG family ribbon-helix-helix protein n=1 Tax=Brevundimonas sp. TaxID=1871086 RepID=UPI002AB82AC4|nr:CopG family ribbon-helix-helix protein [Brevundimonas sp.]MDZ4362377.1 CopG family ribbon-helix-helix protein [Brevundimonas sp.]